MAQARTRRTMQTIRLAHFSQLTHSTAQLTKVASVMDKMGCPRALATPDPVRCGAGGEQGRSPGFDSRDRSAGFDSWVG